MGFVYMLSSLRSKVLLSLTGTVLLSTLLIMFFVKKETDVHISLLQNQNAKHFSTIAAATVESHYVNLLYLKQSLLEQKKENLHDVIQLALIRVEEYYAAFLRGDLSEDEAKFQVKNALKKMRYGGGGYVWINDTGRPVPRMVMHPMSPDLDGNLLNDPVFNCALGKDVNLFVAAVDVALRNGKGFIDYLWPKPSGEGFTSRQAKLSLVKYFEKWNWVIGTGIYIDDIERSVQERLTVIIDDLRDNFSQVRVGESGYMFLFNGKKEMLIHPSLAGADFSRIINPTTGNPILDDLVESSQTPSKMLAYQWDKPPKHKSDYRFWKNSHISYFEPFDWYIASSVYTDEIEAPARAIARYILLLSMAILFFIFVLSFWLSRSLTKPLKLLTEAGQRISSAGMEDATIPVTGSIETRRLGLILNQMLGSIKDSVRIQEDLFKTKSELETRLHQAEKMESVGRLAAGIAHEINTPIQYVSSNIDFLHDATTEIQTLLSHLLQLVTSAQENGELDARFVKSIEDYFDTADWEYLQEEMPNALNQSTEGMRRISKIVSAMKTFAHPSSGSLEPTDINCGIQSTVTVASNEWKNVTDIELLFEENLPLVPCYADELNQVFLNMIINSVHAIQEHNHGTEGKKGLITIQTLTAGNDVHIRISDTGGGIEDSTLKKIFDPFFTTKDVGVGTGQGLTIAYDIITIKHQGSINVESELGKGTTFSISIPIDPPGQQS